MYENRTKPLLSRQKFYHRLARSAVLALSVVVGSLLVGMAGYHIFENMSWVDAFANASMILSGMGPLGELKTTGGKIFAGCYALFSGLAFITIAGVVLGPFIHRLFHRFLLADDQDGKADSNG